MKVRVYKDNSWLREKCPFGMTYNNDCVVTAGSVLCGECMYYEKTFGDYVECKNPLDDELFKI